MAAISGNGGSVQMGAVTLQNIGDWTISLKTDKSVTTPYGQAWHTKTTTIKDWSGKFNGRLDSADTTGQVAFINGLGTYVTMTFNVDGVHKWTGPAIIDGIDPKSSATGTVDVAFSVDGNGACVYS